MAVTTRDKVAPTRRDWAVLPLRGFLGVTFTFAGLQKLANPDFFRAGSPVSIQSQLAGAARHSPIHPFLTGLGHVAVPVGVLIALGELAVGLGTLAGLHTRVAAGAGVVLSLCLFLSVSFHSSPYYTGSDIVFVFAWTPLLLGGPGPLAADAVLAGRARRAAREGTGGPEMGRRAFALRAAAAGVLAVVGMVMAGLAAAVGRLVGGTSVGTPPRALGSGSSPATPTTRAEGVPAPPTTSSRPAGAPPAPAHPPGTRVGPARAVPVGGVASFDDPATGDPALVVQPRAGTFLAFDSVCPHAGCPVQYSGPDGRFVCPCHGSVFNGRTGAVEVGPAQSGLTRIPIAEGPDGQLYAR